MMPPKPLRLAISADLHYGTRHTTGNRATQDMVAHLVETPPDVLILAGDIGAGDDFARALALFDRLSCHKVLVPGNHDIWVRPYDDRGDSMDLYERRLPALCRDHDFVYLDQHSLLLPEHDLAIVGTMNWYDYTWDNDVLREVLPDWETRLQTKRFSRGMHNDANFVRWPTTDIAFTKRVVKHFATQLDDALAQCGSAVVVAHHPPLHGLLYPTEKERDPDVLLWRAFSGNTQLEALLTTHAARIPLVFCGHTHTARECQVGSLRGYNIGSDYSFKRLLEIDWPNGTMQATEFLGEE